MDENRIAQLGDELYQAWLNREVVAPLSERHPGMSIEDAYQVQRRMIERRLQAGERVVGKKVGVTSLAVMNMLGVYQPDFGYLLDAMIYGEGQAIPADSLIQPKAEGEIAFLLKKDLSGPGVGAADVLAATEGVMACFEIVDSRIRDWKIAIQDTIADNASCGALVLGNALVDPRKVDLALCGMVFEKNGEVPGGIAISGPASRFDMAHLER
ncbi:MAG: 2-oxopent-4-enoate hydratase, partial [Pollutimonas bauzanensis]